MVLFPRCWGLFECFFFLFFFFLCFVAFRFYVEAVRLTFGPGLILNCNYAAILKESSKANMQLRPLRPADSGVKGRGSD